MQESCFWQSTDVGGPLISYIFCCQRRPNKELTNKQSAVLSPPHSRLRGYWQSIGFIGKDRKMYEIATQGTNECVSFVDVSAS